MVEAVQTRLPERFHFPADREGAEMAVRDTRLDDTPARRDLGITPIPFDQSVRDEIAWAVDAGAPAGEVPAALGRVALRDARLAALGSWTAEPPAASSVSTTNTSTSECSVAIPARAADRSGDAQSGRR